MGRGTLRVGNYCAKVAGYTVTLKKTSRECQCTFAYLSKINIAMKIHFPRRLYTGYHVEERIVKEEKRKLILCLLCIQDYLTHRVSQSQDFPLRKFYT